MSIRVSIANEIAKQLRDKAKEIAKQFRDQAKVLELQADALDADVPLPFGDEPRLLMLRLAEVANVAKVVQRRRINMARIVRT